jgi:hypothetical protein
MTDAFLLANHHINVNDDAGPPKLSICQFAGMLAFQLSQKAKRMSALPRRFLPEEDAIPVVSVMGPTSNSNVSDLSSPDMRSLLEKEIVHALQDANGQTHYLVKYDIT